MAKRKTKSKEVSAHETATEPTPVTEVLDRSPAVAAILEAREARTQLEPDRPLSEPDEAVAAFTRQREREQAVGTARYRKTPDFLGGVATDVKVIDEPQASRSRSHVEFGSLPPTVKTIFRSEEKGFRLMEDYANRKRLIQFLEKPPQPDIDELMANGLQYDGGKQQWWISLVPPKPPEGELTRDQIVGYAAEIRDMTDRLALSMSGKAERLGYEVGGRSA
ncbi:hypothetical protein OJF2_51630 [Aquisphaera giovannonii]|uniref:Uncharacterized protein n=1 Tax=Aquisphaera giovannonii TaxID=406548 RepID=A0A5B9W8T9_9BACT|nr:hypothetical protein [Aquisphaera giovannonii]QEH36579.1 hypothetical protein OJF2_51630 [Aquisphaera giovannonii]